MTAVLDGPRTAAAAPATLQRSWRFELVKLLAQWPVRLGLAACWLGPAVLLAVLSSQRTLPTDTVFGRWLHQSGWAAPLVLLTFSATWVLPLLPSLVAGDAFAAEDRLGTWRHLLVAVRSPRRVFVSKALAGLTVVLALVTGLAVSGVAGGLLAVGSRPLVGLTGQQVPPGDAALAVLLAWLVALAPTLAFAAVGVLGAVALGRSPVGLLAPALLAFALQVAQLLPLPVVVRMSLPTQAFLAWRGLLTEPEQLRPLVVGVCVSLVWAAAATALAYRLFLRRDFTDLTPDGLGAAALAQAVLPLAALLAVTAGVVAVLTPAAGSGIERPALETSLSTTYAHLYRLQARELGRPDVPESRLAATATCDRGGPLQDDVGPGNGWRCVVSWHLPDTSATGSAIYQLDVTADGRYVADGDGPQQVNGFFQVRTPTGDAPNPLWQFDGSVDLLP